MLNGNSDLLIASVTNNDGMALDAPNRKVFWAEVSAGRIQRANFDGTSFEDVLSVVPAPSRVVPDSAKPTSLSIQKLCDTSRRLESILGAGHGPGVR